MTGFRPVSVWGNYFIGIDGEGFMGDEYGLLDSSLTDYPRLYTGTRLTTVQCLDWLWGLREYSYGKLCLYGAGYDYNNWLRDVAFADVQRLANSQLVRVGNYLVLWMQRFKFEVRKIEDEDTSLPEYSPRRYKYARIQKQSSGFGRHDSIGLTFWDVLPWWQTSFVKALELTLGEHTHERDLIIAGKDARGSFTYDNIEWVSRYNKAECINLAHMLVELDKWLHQAGIKPMHYNGPGAAAKALLRLHVPYLHAGRKIDSKARDLSHRVGQYVFPGADSEHAMIRRTLSAYAGALNRQMMIGYHPGECWQYDIISAYPYAMTKLPCLTHGEWQRTARFNPHYFGLWKINYKATKHMDMHPFFWRDPKGGIEHPWQCQRWAYTSEVHAALAVDAGGVRIEDGWIWIPGVCDELYPFAWMQQVFTQRQAYKDAGNIGAATGLKLPMNSTYGSIAQARGGMLSRPPWSQQMVWAGAITAYTRTRLYLAYQTNPKAVAHMATDGIISMEKLPLKLGTKLGDWEEIPLHDVSIIQQGIYVAREKHRERGFMLKDEEVPDFIKQVHDMWRTGHWASITLNQHIFITAGLVAVTEKRFDEWCQWQDVPKIVPLTVPPPFKRGLVLSVPGMYPVQDGSKSYMGTLPASMPYMPHWGKGDDFPLELRKKDEWMTAVDASVTA